MSGIWGQGVARSPQGDAVSVGHFTHFAFTVNFTHYVKTKPDSGFTRGEITNPGPHQSCVENNPFLRLILAKVLVY